MRKNWKADEMEMHINFRAMRVAYVFSVLALTVYCGYELIATGQLPAIPTLICCMESFLFFAVKLFLGRKAAAGEADDEE